MCGYGAVADAPLRLYLEEVAAVCRARGVVRVIVSGGATTPGIDRTEAEVMEEILRPLLPGVEFEREPRARTTLDNIAFSCELLGRAADVLLFVDRVRAPKARLLAAMLLRRANVEIVAIRRPEPFIIRLWQLVTIPLQAAGAALPPLRRLLHRLARRR